jgi:uncharacterized protein
MDVPGNRGAAEGGAEELKIWFDADNAPHVLVMRPIALELTRRGHEVFFTARDRSSTCELLDLYGLPYHRIGGSSVKSGTGKIATTLMRAVSLTRAVRRIKPDLSFGHGSRSLPIASRMLGIPSVTMFDYEWVNPLIFNRFCRTILLPEVIGQDRAAEAGINTRRIRFFPGLKEQLYLADREFAGVPSHIRELTGGKPYVLLRPPASTAHYHNPESEKVFEALLENLTGHGEFVTVMIPRSMDDPSTGQALKRGALIPDRILDGPELVWNASLVAGGGGTMTREGAVLGVPSVSFFMGRGGRVDEYLVSIDRLSILRDARSAGSLDPSALKRSSRLEVSVDLPGYVADTILDRSAATAD